VRSTIEIRGAVVAETNGTIVNDAVFTLANAIGGEAIDLTAPGGAISNTMIIDYRDNSQRVANVPWQLVWIVRTDTDNLLEAGELAEITVDLSSVTLGPNTQFALEIKPAQGGVVVVERTTPAYLDPIIDLR
jgi:archaellin